MSNRELTLQLHEELDRRENLRTQLDHEIDAIRTALAILARPTPEQRNRVTKVVGRRGEFSCDKCGAEFKSAAGCGRHRKACDGKFRTPEERNQENQRRFLERKAKRNGGAAEHPTPAKPADSLPRVGSLPCDVRGCDELFMNARELGMHKTMVHYGEDGSGGRRSTLMGS